MLNRNKVTFNETSEVKKFTPEFDKNEDIYSIKGKIVNIVDDEVEDRVELLKEVQFLIDEKHEIIAIINKAGELVTDKESISKQHKMFVGAEFADLQKNILGTFAKNDKLNFSKEFALDEEIVARKEVKVIDENNNKEILPGKLLYIEHNGQKMNRYGQSLKVDVVKKIGKDFFEDSGKNINTNQAHKNFKKPPLKSALKQISSNLQKHTTTSTAYNNTPSSKKSANKER